MTTSRVVLYIPDVTGLDTLAAALAYAAAGWYVLPVKRGSKHPGSVVGFGWNDQSSREPAVIIAWFAGTDYGIALHCGRSGAVVIDLDAPENMPAEMRIALLASDPPMQATRSGDDLRGHYLYLQPEGRVLGNGTGQLGAGWGDVRGLNGVIIVAPSVHEAPDGEYRWMQTGPLAALPAALADKLHDASPSEDAASDAEIAAFVLAHTASSSPHLADAWLATFRKGVGAGESRHGKAISIGAGALKEAAAGLFSAAEFIPALHREFIAAAARPPLGGKQGSARTGKVAESEWAGILAWAVAQARSAEVGATLARLAEHAPGMPPSWVHGATVPQAVTVPAPLIAPLSVPQSPAPVPVADELHAQLVVHEVAIQRARREAAQVLDSEEHARRFRVPPFRATLTEDLALPRRVIEYRIAEVMPAKSNVLLTAQFKAGKTSVLNHLAKCLADGLPFLGQLLAIPPDKRIAIFNYEVGEQQYTDWLRDAGVVHADRITVLNLRGYSLPLMAPRITDWVVDWLSGHDIGVWFLDPYARAAVGSITSENDNTEAGRLLDHLDVIKERAGVDELVMPVHTGRMEFEEGTERARGATRLDDWADVRWLLTKDESDQRFFRATGRDVEYDEKALEYNEADRSYQIVGGSKAETRQVKVRNAVYAAILNSPDINNVGIKNAIRTVVKARDDAVDAAVAELERDHLIDVIRQGSGRPTLHRARRRTAFGTIE